jgi:hypothetical protein
MVTVVSRIATCGLQAAFTDLTNFGLGHAFAPSGRIFRFSEGRIFSRGPPVADVDMIAEPVEHPDQACVSLGLLEFTITSLAV